MIEPKFEKYFIDFDLMGGMFVVKPHGTDGHIPPHQDFSLVDERKYWALNTWCPLDDTELDFGMLMMLPGSHRFMHTIRGYGIPEHYKHLTEIIEKNFVPIKMKAGEVVIFYLSMVHGSSLNLKNDPRVAIGCSVIPNNIKLEYCMIPDNQNIVKRFSVEKTFFTNKTSEKNSEPDAECLVETFVPNFKIISNNEFEKLLKQTKD